MQLSPKFEEALVYANRAHLGQLRKQTHTPYIAHILGVAGIALDYGASEEEAIAALLHDAVEDAGGAERLRDIEARFGKTVATIVEGCTDTDKTPKPPWLERKLEYVREAATAAPALKLVSAADKLHNVRSIVSEYRVLGEKLWSRFNGGKEGSLWYYRALVTALECERTKSLVEELDRAVSEIERLSNNGVRVTSPC